MEVTFVASVQAHQVERIREMAARLRNERPDVKVTLVEGDAAKPLLLQHKLNYGPAILIDGRVEYVGIPRWRFLVERIAQVGQKLLNPRSVIQPEKAAPAKAATATPTVAPAKPATPSPPVPGTAPQKPAPETAGS